MTDAIRIGTWNVEYAYERRLCAIEQVLAKNPADIWVLTETHDDLTPPACGFVAHTSPRPKNWSGIRPGSRWVSIWSRYPVLKDIGPSLVDPERTTAALVDVGDQRPLLVYGTVMPWKGDRGIQDWSEHHRVVAQQCAEWQRLRQDFSQADLCVAGDFNTDMSTGAYYGTRKGIALLNEGLAACDLFCATSSDFAEALNLPHPPIDHIALPNAWRDMTSIEDAWPAQKGILSDHSGMVVQVDYHCEKKP